jgi:hypothetical protein
MTPEDLRDAIAARAAGEDLPGIDPADLDARLAADPALRADLDGLARLCETLRGAPVPAARTGRPARPHRPARVSPIGKKGRTGRRFPWWIAIPAAAAELILIAVLARLMKDEGEPPAVPIADNTAPPAVPIADNAAPPAAVEAIEMLREPLPEGKRPEEIGIGAPPEGKGTHRGGPGRGAPPLVGSSGGGPGATDALDPVLAQVDFQVRLPGDLPEGLEVREAKIRRAAVAGQDLIRLVWEGPGTRLVVVETPAAPGVREALGRVKPPEGAVTRIEEAAGTVILIGAVGLTEDEVRGLAASFR